MSNQTDSLKPKYKIPNWGIGFITVVLVFSYLWVLLQGVRKTSQDTLRWSSNQHTARIIGSALSLYYEQNDNTLPPSDRWATALQPCVNEAVDRAHQKYLDRLKREGIKEPPSSKYPYSVITWVSEGHQYEPFAMNRALSGVNVKKIKHPRQVVAFFETTVRKPNASGDQSLQVAPYGERKWNTMVMADGSRLTTQQAEDGSGQRVDPFDMAVTIRWKP